MWPKWLSAIKIRKGNRIKQKDKFKILPPTHPNPYSLTMSNLDKIIDLIKKTGDSCIVLDVDGNPAYVLTTFDRYNNLVLGKQEVAGMTEDQLLEKINRDIACWRDTAQESEMNNWQSVGSLIEKIKKPEIQPLVSEKKPLNQEEKQAETDQYFFEPID